MAVRQERGETGTPCLNPGDVPASTLEYWFQGGWLQYPAVKDALEACAVVISERRMNLVFRHAMENEIHKYRHFRCGLRRLILDKSV